MICVENVSSEAWCSFLPNMKFFRGVQHVRFGQRPVGMSCVLGTYGVVAAPLKALEKLLWGRELVMVSVPWQISDVGS